MLFLCCWWWWQIVKACHEYLYSKSLEYFLTLFLTCQPYQFDVTYATMTISRVRNWLLNTPSPKSLFHTLSDSFIKKWVWKGENRERKRRKHQMCVSTSVQTSGGITSSLPSERLWGHQTLQSPTRWKRAPLITKLVISHKCQNQGPHLKQPGNNTALIS